MTIGRIGEYFRRVIFRRLGMTLKLRDRVYEPCHVARKEDD